MKNFLFETPCNKIRKYELFLILISKIKFLNSKVKSYIKFNTTPKNK